MDDTTTYLATLDLDKIRLDALAKNALKNLSIRSIKNSAIIPMGAKEILALLLENEDFERQNKAMRAELKILQNALQIRTDERKNINEN